MTPVIEEALRLSGVAPNHEQVIERFMNGAPRIAVVRGSEDHPPAIGSKEMARRLVRCIWLNGALPFELTQSFPCEELSRGTDGAHYALLSRNFCTANMAAHMESHGYDSAIVIGVCDKMMVGNLRALIEADLARQRRRARPVFAMLIPSLIGREVHATEDEKRRFEPLKARLPEFERRELQSLLQRALKPSVYEQIHALLERYFHQRVLQENEMDELARVFVKCTSMPGANCAASATSMIHRLMLASLGMVPRHFDILTKSPADEQLHDAIKRMITCIQKRERRMSAASLTRSNIINASAVWSATGGHPGWLLHLSYLADAIGKKLTMEDIARKANTVPQILAMDESTGSSAYAMGLEVESGVNSGIDTLMRTLAEKRFIEDRASTLDGPWMQRIMEARSANGNFLYSTMTPYSPTCGSFRVQGNMCSGAVFRMATRRDGVERFDKKLYLAVCYLGVKDLVEDLASGENVMDRLKRKVDRNDLFCTWAFNSRKQPANKSNGADETASHYADWNKNRLWDYLSANGMLRLMIVVAGAGPRAAGMPEIQLTCPALPNLASMGVILTDGRVSFQHSGLSISQMVPEAFEGGGLAAIRTGDWIYMDLSHRELHVVSRARNSIGFKPLSSKDLVKRPELKKHVRELGRQRMELIPSFRIMMDGVSSADSGVSPKSN
jgi:dihydroxyacid dehydratase/phosphogluconate dehydratase